MRSLLWPVLAPMSLISRLAKAADSVMLAAEAAPLAQEEALVVVMVERQSLELAVGLVTTTKALEVLEGPVPVLEEPIIPRLDLDPSVVAVQEASALVAAADLEVVRAALVLLLAAVGLDSSPKVKLGVAASAPILLMPLLTSHPSVHSVEDTAMIVITQQ
ncbi:hypothetical protein BC939DRAFT_440842 [Gamsiella multidivaricata]|uniref:uncharacterized protein n=1 Tax=Gamsiella multidivaricata TaxID=101098 RepID=UPI00221F0B89|nr:uncharacterized protein BC939DRAFT_440842 [Gamsiella multidivaricata]KAI7829853.1 hypothetical protein BC939DRAFT_440842 [Gamsiella multidivaricata]